MKLVNTTSSFVSKLCAALGVNPNHARRMVITIAVGEIVSVEIERFADADQVEGLDEIISSGHYRLVEVTEPTE